MRQVYDRKTTGLEGSIDISDRALTYCNCASYDSGVTPASAHRSE